MKKNNLTNNKVIAFDSIKIQTQQAPQNDRLNLSFVKDICVVAKKMTTNCQKWQFLKLKFSKKILQKLKNTLVKHFFDLCHRF